MIIPVVSESKWLSRLIGLPNWEPALKPTTVIAPHPDDETLGAGGLIATLRARGVEVTLVAVTDGENAYPDAAGLAGIREREQTEALARLGVDSGHIRRLRLPDSNVSDHEPQLMDGLMSIVHPNSQIIAPWRHDFHPDHEACGRAAEMVATQKRASLASYFFWTWHRGVTETLAGLPLRYLPLGAAECRAKREAVLCHRSQLQRDNGDPILPENLLKPAWRTFEVFLPA
jgi:LmbE family N-acetylglucosaminyl deacetylase